MATNFYSKDIITIAPGQLKELTYGIGESPNHFYVNNLSGAVLYCGISIIPSVEVSEMKVEGNSARLVAARDGSGKFYILNSSNTSPATIILHSFKHEFDPSILATANQSVSLDMQGVTIEGGGTIDEIKCSLPGGANTIGFVGLNAGNNRIGSVGVDTVPQVLETAAKNINDYMAAIAAAAGEIQTLTSSLKTLQQESNNIWTPAKITQLMSAVNNIAAVAGGEEFTGNLEVRTDELTEAWTWNLETESKYINKVNYIRCTKGTITIALNYGASLITLEEGEAVNDISGMITYMIITPSGGTAAYEMLYSYVVSE